MSFNRIKNLRKEKKMTQTQLAKLLHTTQANVSSWESGKWEPDFSTLAKMCDIFECPIDFILDLDEYTGNTHSCQIPVIGTIPAGTPIEAIENLDCEMIYLQTPLTSDYFALRVKGDSMTPTINDNDIAIIRKQDDANSGQICVVMINGYDATLKEIKKESTGLWVLPHNPNSGFKPTFYTNKEVEELPVRILGVAVEIRRNL